MQWTPVLAHLWTCQHPFCALLYQCLGPYIHDRGNGVRHSQEDNHPAYLDINTAESLTCCFALRSMNLCLSIRADRMIFCRRDPLGPFLLPESLSDLFPWTRFALLPILFSCHTSTSVLDFLSRESYQSSIAMATGWSPTITVSGATMQARCWLLVRRTMCGCRTIKFSRLFLGRVAWGFSIRISNNRIEACIVSSSVPYCILVHTFRPQVFVIIRLTEKFVECECHEMIDDDVAFFLLEETMYRAILSVRPSFRHTPPGSSSSYVKMH